MTLGKKRTVTVGGENTLAFHTFEGTQPHGPKIAMEVYDLAPSGWAAELQGVPNVSRHGRSSYARPGEGQA